MKKKGLLSHAVVVLFAFLISGIISCKNKIYEKTEEDKERAIVLKNNIHSITVFKTIYFLGIPGREETALIKIFDKKGLKVKELAYLDDGNIDFMTNLEYDKSGNMIRARCINKDSSLLFMETRNYDENGNRKEMYFYLPDGSYKYRNTAIYDGEQKMIGLDWYWPSGLKSKNKYLYYKGKKIEDIESDPKGKFQYKWVYQYDESGNLIESVQYYPGDVINSKIVFKFSKDNLPEKQINYFGESIQSQYTFEYDRGGLLSLKTEYDTGGKILVNSGTYMNLISWFM